MKGKEAGEERETKIYNVQAQVPYDECDHDVYVNRNNEFNG